MSEEKIMGFEEILGNEMVKDHFKKAIQNHKISHAYILTGEAGDRKSTRLNSSHSQQSRMPSSA